MLLVAATCSVVVGAGSTAEAQSSRSNKLTVKAGEYVYRFSGNAKPGWVQFEFDNQGVEYHMAGMVALKGNVTAKQLKAALLSDDPDAGSDLVRGSGDVAPQPGFLGPGEKATNILELNAGRYGVFCFIPAPDGKSHVEHGMFKVFDLKGAKSSYKPPTDGVIDVSLTESSVDFPATLPRSSTLKITNDAAGPRSLNFASMLPGVTPEQADAYFQQLFSGEAGDGDPPAVVVGGVNSIPPGGITYLQFDLAPGSYAFSNEDATADDDPAPVLGAFTVS
jgi:hypothetical protein